MKATRKSEGGKVRVSSPDGVGITTNVPTFDAENIAVIDGPDPEMSSGVLRVCRNVDDDATGPRTVHVLAHHTRETWNGKEGRLLG